MSRAASVPPAHAFLRRATARLHHRIDRTSVLAALTRPDLQLPVYIATMAALERAYRDIDNLCFHARHLCPATIPAYVPRSLGIVRDLRALDVVSRNSTSPPCLTAPDTQAAYLGMRYVVEGAQLGSRFIYTHLLEVFGGALPEFASFWSPNPAIQSSWPAVLKALACLESRDCVATAARAARLTFRHMEARLTPH